MKQKIKCDKEDLNRFAPIRPSFGMSAFSIKPALSQNSPQSKKKILHKNKKPAFLQVFLGKCIFKD